VNLQIHDNDTITFNQRKIFKFAPELSAGDEEDMVVVPNIPMLVSMFPLCSVKVLISLVFIMLQNVRGIGAVTGVSAIELVV
jgi:hypothetical protein